MTQSKDTFEPIFFTVKRKERTNTIIMGGRNYTVKEFADLNKISYALILQSIKLPLEECCEKINKARWKKQNGFAGQVSVGIDADGSYFVARQGTKQRRSPKEEIGKLGPRKNIEDVKMGSIERRWLRDNKR